MQSEPDLNIEPMEEHPLYFVARNAHPLATRARVTPTDTFSFPFISPARIPPRLLEPMLAAQRKADPTALARAFPSVECNSLAAVKRIVAGSNAITAATLQGVSSELESGTFALLGREPWLTVRYGVVVLKGHPLSSAAMRLRELVIEAEQAVAVEEKQLLKRWKPGRGSRKSPVRLAGRSIRL
jgi:DNA-binding transcriptional LysR family regulator